MKRFVKNNVLLTFIIMICTLIVSMEEKSYLERLYEYVGWQKEKKEAQKEISFDPSLNNSEESTLEEPFQIIASQKAKDASYNAIEKGNLNELQNWITNQEINVDEDLRGGFTPLMVAAQTGQLEITKYLLSIGANPNIKDRTNGETALMKIVMKSWGILKKEEPESEEKYTEIVKVLLENKANPNITNNQGQTPLMWAAAYGLTNIVNLLMQHNALVTPKDNRGQNVYDYTADPVLKKAIQDREITNLEKSWTPLH